MGINGPATARAMQLSVIDMAGLYERYDIARERYAELCNTPGIEIAEVERAHAEYRAAEAAFLEDSTGAAMRNFLFEIPDSELR